MPPIIERAAMHHAFSAVCKVRLGRCNASGAVLSGKDTPSFVLTSGHLSMKKEFAILGTNDHPTSSFAGGVYYPQFDGINDFGIIVIDEKLYDPPCAYDFSSTTASLHNTDHENTTYMGAGFGDRCVEYCLDSDGYSIDKNQTSKAAIRKAIVQHKNSYTFNVKNIYTSVFLDHAKESNPAEYEIFTRKTEALKAYRWISQSCPDDPYSHPLRSGFSGTVMVDHHATPRFVYSGSVAPHISLKDLSQYQDECLLLGKQMDFFAPIDHIWPLVSSFVKAQSEAKTD